MGVLHFTRPDGEKVAIVREAIIQWSPAEQGAGHAGHVSTIYLSNGQFREVRETVAQIEAAVGS